METHTFQDFDAFASTVRDVDCGMLMSNTTQRRWSISYVNLPGIHVQRGLEGGGNITEGQARPDGYVLFVPLNHYGAHAANGTALDNYSLAILEPGCDFCVRCETEHDWCSIFIPSQALAQGGELVEPASGSEKTVCRVTRPNLQLADQFRARVHQVMTTATQCPQFESSPAAMGAVADLLKVASVVIGKRQGHEPAEVGRPELPREEIIRSSKELLEQRDGEPVLVGDLAAAADVSERTLRRAFHEYFGMGPVRYLQLRRLHQVHRALRAADAEVVSVADVLLRHGVWEFSRFAARYRRLFGERPSETLRTKKAVAIFTGAGRAKG